MSGSVPTPVVAPVLALVPVLVLVTALCLAATALVGVPARRVRAVGRSSGRRATVVALSDRVRSRLTRDVAAEAAEWVGLLRRLCALLQAGRSPAAAFEGAGPSGRLGPGTPTGRHIEALCAAVGAAARLGLSTTAALTAAPAPALGHRALEQRAASATAELSLCWEVAERTGAPLAGLLDGLAEALEAELDADAARRSALAGPRSTVRVLSWLPVLGISLGMLMGVDPLRTLLTTPWGLAALAAGAALTIAGRAWTRALIHRAEAGGAR